MCPEKVERLISIDCWSPMSASTWSKTGSAAVAAGGRRPDWWSSAARPSVFSATVLPPVFGPLTTSARSVAEVEVDRDGGRRVEQRMARAERAGPRPETRPARRASGARACRTRAPGRSRPSPRRARASASARRADGGRQLAQDPLDLLALGAGGLGLAVVQLDDLERLDEERLARARRVVDDARHAAARARLHREHGPAAALGDEVLLQVLAQAGDAREPAQLLGDALPAVAELAAQPAQERRGVVAQVGAVVLDAAADLLRERRERRVDRGRRARAAAARARLLASRAARARGRRRSPPRSCAARRARARRRAPRARPASGRPATPRAAARRLVEQRDRLGGQRLPARDLVGVGRRHERARELRAVGGRRRGREPLGDRRETRARRGRSCPRAECTSVERRDPVRRGFHAHPRTWPESRTRAMPWRRRRGVTCGSAGLTVSSRTTLIGT